MTDGTKRPFVIINEQVRARAIEAVRTCPIGYGFTLGPAKRSLEQSAKLHAIFGEFSKQMRYNGEFLTPEQFKVLLISAHTVATGNEPQFVIGVEGEPVNLRESTAAMTVARMSSLIEYCVAYGAQNNVKFHD